MLDMLRSKENSNAEVLDNILLRIAGETFDVSDDLKLNEAVEVSKRSRCEKSTLDEGKKILIDRLFDEIKSIQNEVARKKLLNIKRDIFNDRMLNKKDYESVIDFLSSDTIDELNTFLESRLNFLENYKKGEYIYNHEVQNVQANFRRSLQNEYFIRGLMMGSSVLTTALSNYVKSDEADCKNDQVEIGLIKYYSRMFSKTSPFAAFTNLAIAKLGENDAMVSISQDKEGLFDEIFSLVRLNGYILNYLLNVLSLYPPFYKNVYLKLNPTLIKNSSQCVFLANSNNSEAIQTIALNQVLEAILCKYSEGCEFTFNQLVVFLEGVVDEDHESLQKFVQSLLKYGIIEYDYRISGLDPNWIEVLTNQLERAYKESCDENLRLWSEQITLVRLMIEKFSISNIRERIQLQKEIYDRILNVYLQIHSAAELSSTERENIVNFSLQRKLVKNDSKTTSLNKTDNDNLFTKKYKTNFFIPKEKFLFEDTSRKSEFLLNRQKAKQIADVLAVFSKELILVDLNKRKRLQVLDYFLEKYDRSENVPLLHFYENYSKYQKTETKDSEIFKYRTQYENDFQKWQRNIKNSLLTKFDNNDEINISILDLQNARGDIDIFGPQTSISFGCFVQMYGDSSEGPLAVLNGVYEGYGKYVGRFLPLFDKAINDYYVYKNGTLMGENIFAEQSDFSFFNANIHPPLLKHEITANSNNNYLPKEQQISVKDILVRYDIDSNELYLFDTISGKKVYVFDLAFQSVSGRAPIFRFLLNFTQAKIPDFGFLFNTVMETFQQQRFGDKIPKEVIQYPRIVLDSTVVFSRKGWLIPTDFFPVIKATDSSWDIFNIVKDWQKRHKIPDHVFLTFSKVYDSDLKIDLKGDATKPQFIDFNNPLLLKLFLKLLSKGATLMLTEMLPTREQLVSFQNRRYVTEALIQVNV